MINIDQCEAEYNIFAINQGYLSILAKSVGWEQAVQGELNVLWMGQLACERTHAPETFFSRRCLYDLVLQVTTLRCT